MCARYKASDPESPAPSYGGGRGRFHGQAAQRPRVQPTRSEYGDEPEEDAYPDAAPPQRNAPADYGEDRPAFRMTQPPAPARTARPRRLPQEMTEEDDYREVSADAFGFSRAELESERRSYGTPPREQENPINEFRRPPRKGLGCLGAIWLVLTLPFRIIAFFTRHLPKLILWPLRLIISMGFCGLVLAGILITIYVIRSGRYDITQVMHMPERSIVLDRKGTEIGTLHGENRRSLGSLQEVPKHFIDALVVQEDRSFWTHGGIDPRGMLRAVAQVFKHHRTTQGGSTLTMQLAKNTYNHQVRDFNAKLTEMALARRIEATYDKQTILLCYLNRVFFGHTFLGLKQAASGYFDKQPRDLSIGESAMLAGIICNPNGFSPYRNLAKALEQRNKVLANMHKFGYITRTQYEQALAEPVTLKTPERRGIDNYALDLVRSEVDQVLRLLEAKDQRIREEVIYSGGLKVQTTLDLDLQDDVMRELDARLTAMFEKTKGYKHQTRAQFQAERAALPAEKQDGYRPKYIQASCTIIHNATGALLAVVGGRDSTESPLNRALQCRRQVGSVFKPIVYSTFFERGGTAQSLISDDRIAYGEVPGAKKWSPHNSDGRFCGMQAAGWGLLKSRNTMSVRVGMKAGLSNVVNSALMSGFPRPQRSPGPTIYLGTWEASTFEVAGAYTTFANGGVRPTPYIIESITDANGHVLWQNTPTSRRIFSQRTAATVSGILQQITKPGGTAGNVQKLGFKHPCGGKTGTTNNYTNAWFCGFTSDLTAAVWVGFDRNTKIAEKAYGGTVALPLWVGAMQCAEARGYPMKDIRTAPAKVRHSGLRLCRESGMLAHSGCEYEGKAYIETMGDLEKPRGICTLHAELAEDPDADGNDEVAEDPDETPDTTPDIDDVAEEA